MADRLVASLGFGLEARPDSELPGPEGTLLLAAGAALLLLVRVARPARRSEPPLEDPPHDEVPLVRGPATADEPGPRQRIFLDR